MSGDIEKAAGHGKEGVGAAVCGEKRKRMRKATKDQKKWKKREGKREEESITSSLGKAAQGGGKTSLRRWNNNLLVESFSLLFGRELSLIFIIVYQSSN